jgi:hypothetical protein
MQYSLQSLFIVITALAVATGLISQFGWTGVWVFLLLCCLVAIVVTLRRKEVPNSIPTFILLSAIQIHILQIQHFFPVAEDWTCEAMSEAIKRGYEMQMDENDFFILAMIVCNFIYGYPVMLLSSLIISEIGNYFSMSIRKRLLCSVWLLFLPIISGCCVVAWYQSQP